MHSNNPSSTKKMGRWPYLLAGIISSTLMIWSALWGYAEIITITPRHNIAQWEKPEATTNLKAANEAMANLQKAISLNSNNADFYMDLARLSALQANSPQLSSQERKQYQDQTIKNLKLTLSKRPSWGLAWAKLAQAYATDPKQSSSFIQALERAVYFEPYEKLSQQHIIPLAIAQWETLPNAIKDRTKAIIQHALRYQPKIIHLTVNTAITYGWEDELAPLLTRKWHKNILNQAINKKKQNVDKGKLTSVPLT